MHYLQPTSSHIIPVHPSTEGYNTHKLSVDVHEYPGISNPDRNIAFVFCHALGFNKECFHPLMRALIGHIRSLEEYNRTNIAFVSIDARYQGESARLNKDQYYPSYRAIENGLDTKQVIDTLELNCKYDQLIGIGLSMGGASILLLEYLYPNTFSSMMVAEPIIRDYLANRKTMDDYGTNLAVLKRRDEWSNKEACFKYLESKQMFKTFHPSVLSNYVNYGMYETEKGSVKLKCKPESEHHLILYASSDCYLAYRSLRHLTTPVHFVYVRKSGHIDFTMAKNVVNENKKFITSELFEGGHLFPYEQPERTVPFVMKALESASRKYAYYEDELLISKAKL